MSTAPSLDLSTLSLESVPLQLVESIRANVCRANLKPFIETFWHIVEPGNELLWNWHHDELCQDLEALTRDELLDNWGNPTRNLIVNIPPGTGKSLFINVFHSAWEWASDPSLRHLSASYSSDNTIRDNLKLRDIVTCELYRRMFWDEFIDSHGEVKSVTLTSEQHAKIRFNTSEKGYSIATSVRGLGTGEHPDRIRIDDPHKAIEADSEIKRDKVGDWYTNTISTRKARRPATIIDMQRLDEDDLSGRELSKGGYKHLLMPMRYESTGGSIDDDTKKELGRWDCACHSSGLDKRDPRTYDGELLFPQLYNERDVERFELDPFEFATQYQQRPSAIVGGLVKRIWFPIVEEMPAGRIKWGRGYDAAATEGAGAFSVGTKMGRFITGAHKGKFIIDLDAEIREQVDDFDPYIYQTATLDSRRCVIREEQEPGSSGKKIIAAHTRQLAGYDYEGVSSTGDKVMKSRPFRIQCKAGNIILYSTDPRRTNDWLREVCGFPLYKYKDRMDSAAIIFNGLTLEDKRKVKRARAVGGERYATRARHTSVRGAR